MKVFVSYDSNFNDVCSYMSNHQTIHYDQWWLQAKEIFDYMVKPLI